MISWDIETLGLDKGTHKITVIGLWDPENDFKKVIRFVDMNEYGDIVYCDTFDTKVAEFTELMNNAETLCGFNTMSFDLPFVQAQFKIPNETVQRWVLKTYDLHDICRRGFQRTFNLNSCLALNGVGSGKTGSGMEAVKQALSGDWVSLENYCQDDARLTYEVSMLPVIYCPEGYEWRNKHGGRTHDPEGVLTIFRDKFPTLSFGYGPMPGHKKSEDAVLGKRALT
jgi:predicted PolB exonuclease-like 3'-5' exonuclease